jgi:hypothetical protein
MKDRFDAADGLERLIRGHIKTYPVFRDKG